jgi:hypothetical protein
MLRRVSCQGSGKGGGRRGSSIERKSTEDRHGDELLAIFLARVAQQKRGWRELVIDPSHWALKYWHLLQLLCVLWLFFDVTLTAAFFDTLPDQIEASCGGSGAVVRLAGEQPQTVLHAHDVLNACVDLLLFLHVGLQLRLGYVDSHNNKVMERAQVRRPYLRSWRFLVHTAAALPLDVLRLTPLAAPWPASLSHACGVVAIALPPWRWVHSFSRALKLGRALELPGLLKDVQIRLRLPPHFRRLFGLALAMALIAQVSACGWFLTGKLLFMRGSTLFFPSLLEPLLTDTGAVGSPARYANSPRARRAMQFFDAVYYTLGVMTGLSDGEEPQTWLETLFTVLIMFVGIVVFAVIIGSVSIIVEELSEAESDFQTKKLFMRRMLKQNTLPADMESRVLAYYSYQWTIHQGFDEFKVGDTGTPECPWFWIL